MSKPRINIDPVHYPQHNYLWFCHDVLVSILEYSDEHQMSMETITFPSEEKADEFSAVPQEPRLQHNWFMENGWKEEMYLIYYKHTFFSLLADFCQYMYESINCASEMKVAVAYALLRKPLRDNLYYIEWLYVNRDEVIDILLTGKPIQLEINCEKARERIEAARQKSGISAFEDMYTFRYDKNDDCSLEKIWNKANHLVTTHRYTKTKQGELNFIYSNEEDLQWYIEQYYLAVSYIMGYVAELASRMFEEMTSFNFYTKMINKYNRAMRMTQMSDSVAGRTTLGKFAYPQFPIVCPRCGKKQPLNHKGMRMLLANKYRCHRCWKTIHTSRYIFDFEKLKINKSEEDKTITEE